MLLFRTNLKCKSFTVGWALDSLRITSMLGHLKTLRLPSCTAQKLHDHMAYQSFIRKWNSLHFNAYLSNEWKHCNPVLKKKSKHHMACNYCPIKHKSPTISYYFGKSEKQKAWVQGHVTQLKLKQNGAAKAKVTFWQLVKLQVTI